MHHNIVMLTDSYKISHWKQYPPGTKRVYSYFESRGGRWPNTVFFGLQYYLMRYLSGRVVTQDHIDYAKDRFAKHFGTADLFNERGWQLILKNHGGRLPVSIKAVPEGSVIPTSNVLMTIENTDPELPWLTNYLETLLSKVWYPSTIATQSREMYRLIEQYSKETGDPDRAPVDFKVHDFGDRGSTSVESAGIGDMAHLVSFMGTDTMVGFEAATEFYGAGMAGFSIPAAEHSTITSWGKENEVNAYLNMLQQFPTGLVAVVSDSYDIYRACKDLWGKELRDAVIARDGVLVVRPDSGNPVVVVPEVLDILGAAFGTTVNAKGYRVLHDKVRVIQGDGIDYDMIGAILTEMKLRHWSVDNIAFGSGGGLLQKVNRDTQKFAFKCSAIQIANAERGDEWIPVFKDPVTDPGKVSKGGKLVLLRHGTGYKTMGQGAIGQDLLEEVYRDGSILKKWSWEEVRARARG
jgi:nicotinamide phosphoribosyltransferase